jgi:hypothetical protein
MMPDCPGFQTEFTELVMTLRAFHMMTALFPNVIHAAVRTLPILMIAYFSPNISKSFGLLHFSLKGWLGFLHISQ